MRKKIFIIFTSIILVLSSFIFIQEEVNAVIQKGVTTVMKKSAKKTMFFYIDKRSVELHKEFLKRQKIDELKNGIKKRQGYKTIKYHGRPNRPTRPIHKDREIHYQIKENLTNVDKKRLERSINEAIEKRITGGRKWNLFENILDFFIDYKMWYSIPTVIPIVLKGDTAQEIEDIAIEAMFDADILIPADSDINENNYNDFNLINNDGSTFDYSNPTSLPETGTSWNYENDYEYSDPGDDNPILDRFHKVNFMNEIEATIPNSLFTFDGINFSKEIPHFETLQINFYLEKDDLEQEEGSPQIFDIAFDYKKESDLFSITHYESDMVNTPGVMFKNGKKLNHDEYVFFWDGPRIEVIFPDLNIDKFNRVDVLFIDFTTVHLKLYADDIYDYYYDVSGHFNFYFELVLEHFPNEQITENLLNGKFEVAQIEFNTTRENFENSDFKARYIDMSDRESATKKRKYTNDIETEIPEIIELPAPDYFDLVDNDGKEYEFKEKSNQITIIEKGTDKEIDESTDIEVIIPPTKPLPEPNIPPIEEKPIPDATPTPPKYPDPEDYPNPEAPPDIENPGDGGIIPPFPEGETCGEIDLDLKSIDLFTEKFPFSLPFDVYNAIEALFGKMGENPPEFTYKIMETEIEIKIPDFILDSQKFIRSIILFIFDVSMIYALYRLFGGAS